MNVTETFWGISTLEELTKLDIKVKENDAVLMCDRTCPYGTVAKCRCSLFTKCVCIIENYPPTSEALW